MSHTPGPWGRCYTSYHAHDYRLTLPNGGILPVTAPSNNHSEQRANARLIAAAPELLEALSEAVRCGERDGMQGNPGSRPSWVGKARAAIKKATEVN